ncbi:MAG: hypothetical protein JNM63_06810 [Spirochaetia bacterium]|nr:hypothetical protein [Spirochaetia bacterium]
MKPLARLMLFAALFEIGGLHWWAAQGYAWAKMTWKDHSQYGLVEAVKRSLSGEHPCDVCKKIEKSKSPMAKPWILSDKQSSVLPAEDFEYSLTFAPYSSEIFHSAPKRAEPPLTPPPVLLV